MPQDKILGEGRGGEVKGNSDPSFFVSNFFQIRNKNYEEVEKVCGCVFVCIRHFKIGTC